ncbi:unnamed protein product [Trichogramma brassicae]|uniref:Uncharacterized protein n=1 Tax=Trichogramma brassicae TaxID=86971 RepID=A0A6H5IL67_9HYME|nr:unnamed protein product [Trichogramma brassicae]
MSRHPSRPWRPRISDRYLEAIGRTSTVVLRACNFFLPRCYLHASNFDARRPILRAPARRRGPRRHSSHHRARSSHEFRSHLWHALRWHKSHILAPRRSHHTRICSCANLTLRYQKLTQCIEGEHLPAESVANTHTSEFATVRGSLVGVRFASHVGHVDSTFACVMYRRIGSIARRATQKSSATCSVADNAFQEHIRLRFRFRWRTSRLEPARRYNARCRSARKLTHPGVFAPLPCSGENHFWSLVWCHRPRGVQRELYTQRPSIESSERNVKRYDVKYTWTINVKIFHIIFIRLDRPIHHPKSRSSPGPGRPLAVLVVCSAVGSTSSLLRTRVDSYRHSHSSLGRRRILLPVRYSSIRRRNPRGCRAELARSSSARSQGKSLTLPCQKYTATNNNNTNIHFLSTLKTKIMRTSFSETMKPTRFSKNEHYSEGISGPLLSCASMTQKSVQISDDWAGVMETMRQRFCFKKQLIDVFGPQWTQREPGFAAEIPPKLYTNGCITYTCASNRGNRSEGNHGVLRGKTKLT